MIKGAFGTKNSVAETLIKAVPCCLSGLGLTICYRTGLTSVGLGRTDYYGRADGHHRGGVNLGGLPAPVVIPMAMIAGNPRRRESGPVSPDCSKAKLGVSEAINTIMLNYVATYLVAYLVDGPIQEAAGTIRSLTCWEKTRGFQSSCRGRGCIWV